MKKFVVIILVVIMALASTVAFADTQDYASMDDAALHEMINGARNELAKREMKVAEKSVLFEEEGITLYLTGNYDVWGSDNWYLDLEAVVINDSDATVFVSVDSAYVNGWEVYGSGITDTEGGKKQKGMLEFCISEADISTYEEVEDIEIVFSLFDSDTYETIAELEPITIHVNAE